MLKTLGRGGVVAGLALWMWAAGMWATANRQAQAERTQQAALGHAHLSLARPS